MEPTSSVCFSCTHARMRTSIVRREFSHKVLLLLQHSMCYLALQACQDVGYRTMQSRYRHQTLQGGRRPFSVIPTIIRQALIGRSDNNTALLQCVIIVQQPLIKKI